MHFAPKPNEMLQIFDKELVFLPHPAAPFMVHSMGCRKSYVYKVKNQKNFEYFALKVFKPAFQDKELVDIVARLQTIQTYDGLQAANRKIVTEIDTVIKQYDSLLYAVLMPWLTGETWFDILNRKRNLSLSEATTFCRKFLNALESLEKSGLAHTDIAPGNVMFRYDVRDVQLLDLEDVYMPNSPTPSSTNTGCTGYRHHTAENSDFTCWCREGDRYAAAILSAEILLFSESCFVTASTDEGYFYGHCKTNEGEIRYKEAKKWLAQKFPKFSEVFEKSWYSKTLKECPTISELKEAVYQDSCSIVLKEQPPKFVFVPFNIDKTTHVQKPNVALGRWENLNVNNDSSPIVKTPSSNQNQLQKFEKTKIIVGAVAFIIFLIMILMMLI